MFVNRPWAAIIIIILTSKFCSQPCLLNLRNHNLKLVPKIQRGWLRMAFRFVGGRHDDDDDDDDDVDDDDVDKTFQLMDN